MTPPSRPTMDDVARLAGVSRKTVSRFVNHAAIVSEDTRTRIESAMSGLGFTRRKIAPPPPAISLVALVHDGSDPVLCGLIEAAISDGVRKDRLALAVCLLGNDGAADLRAFLQSYRPIGAILLPPLSGDPEAIALCKAADVRCAGIGESGLTCDDRTAMTDLVNWLRKEGHRRIGLVGGPDDSLIARRREAGYLDALAARSDGGPPLVVAGDGSFESGIAAGRLLLDVSPRPTAIVACNDEMAAGTLHAAAQADVAVPDALSVVGFDDTPLAARTWPPLTSMHIPWDEIAREALTRVIGGESERHGFVADLVLRGSVARAGGIAAPGATDLVSLPGRLARVPPA